MLPIPKAAMAPNSAKSQAVHLSPRPCSRKYIGPPAIVPSGCIWRYLMPRTTSANLVAIPKIPVNHIQTGAPGPPMLIAAATPAILPLPTVAERAIINAWNGVISPGVESSSRSFPRTLRYSIFQAKPSFRNCTSPVPKVSQTPVPTRKTIIQGPQTKALITSMMETMGIKSGISSSC